MPAKKTIAPTLEQPTTPALGDLDENGLERLPDFEAEHAQQVWRGNVEPDPTRDQRIAELDERSERLNGHTPEGVKPSERCGTPSPLGISCTHRTDHPGLHSWTPGPEHDPIPGTEQPTLPGTPEPEQSDYTVPTEASFGKAKLTPAHGLRAIGDRLIADDDSLEHLRGIEIRYAWRRRGGTSGGNPRFARIKRPSVWEEHLTGGRVDFLVDVSADHVREFRFAERQIEAAIHEQLSRTERDDDDHDAFRINGPDFSGSISTMDRFGAWKPELREMHAHVAKLPLEQAIADADSSDGEDSEDE